jgi:hypothetical protein
MPHHFWVALRQPREIAAVQVEYDGKPDSTRHKDGCPTDDECRSAVHLDDDHVDAASPANDVD